VDITTFHASTCHSTGVALWPMVATVVADDSRQNPADHFARSVLQAPDAVPTEPRAISQSPFFTELDTEAARSDNDAVSV